MLFQAAKKILVFFPWHDLNEKCKTVKLKKEDVATTSSIEILKAVSEEEIYRVSNLVWSDLTPQAKITFEKEDVRSEMYLLIYEMQAGVRSCNLVKDGNTIGYLRTVLRRELNRRGRIIDVESDRTRDSDTILASKAAARNVMNFSHLTDGESQGSESIDHLISDDYDLDQLTPEEAMLREQDGLLIDFIRDRMPVTATLLETGDPKAVMNHTSKKDRFHAVYAEFRENIPWMRHEEIKEAADGLSSKRGPRGPYKRRADGPRWKRNDKTQAAADQPELEAINVTIELDSND